MKVDETNIKTDVFVIFAPKVSTYIKHYLPEFSEVVNVDSDKCQWTDGSFIRHIFWTLIFVMSKQSRRQNKGKGAGVGGTFPVP